MAGEFELIERLRQATRQPREDVRLDIGDDAAVLAMPPGHELVAALDTMVEGTHFLPGTAPDALGWKLLATNLSDLAAMGAQPAWAMLGLTLPRADAAWIDGFARGFAQLAARYRLALVGGDTTGGPLAMSVAIHGFVPAGAAITRHGAQVGDVVFVTGTLGDGAAGLSCARALRQDAHAQLLLERMRRPTPRVEAGLALRGVAHACIDVSDGLVQDLGHICAASGVGAELDAAALPLSPALCASFDDAAARRFALAGGDDYELCFCVPAACADSVPVLLAECGGATRIGRIVAGTGVRVRDTDGAWLKPARLGWDHFAP